MNTNDVLVNEFAGDIPTWPEPFDVASDTSLSIEQRKSFYMSNCKKHINGKEVLPNEDTLKMIFDAWDMFGASLCFTFDSYYFVDDKTS
jgi:hypothetical protein